MTTSPATTTRTRRRGDAGVPDGPDILCDNLVRIYRAEGLEVVALQGLDLEVQRGELVALVGASGSGKSTLLGILSGLDTPSAGLARVSGHDLGSMAGRERLEYRRRTVGFLFQQAAANLLPYLTAAENVELPMLLAGVRAGERATRARQTLEVLGIPDCADRRPGQLSGGQQQRVALGVAVANRPRVLLADEPTGELDTRSSDEVFEAIRLANTEFGTTVLVVTHDPLVSEQVARTVGIRDGRTSTEVLRRDEVGADGAVGRVAEEYAVLDRAGRLQLPKAFTASLEMRDRVRLGLEPDHIAVWPTGQPDGAGERGADGSGEERR
ncbi:ABC transporter ATP-binding protein [Phycicoccus sp. HDW14]|uniref:ABC transporter ATP-binding protein n=1 Tax=Phycicoccus sp. HDW14 TaxID=2714941 RepID=UPI00140DF4EB|nr:ABC transporter ATP-binding protein [Phycicoccus sp. HDW14]QIM21302.1 ABC transporter ATP-binding protein [Phycicoccus sp. HDW14]